MTACTNKARGAVVAALAGALALGAAPAVALATTGDVAVMAYVGFEHATLVSATNGDGGSAKEGDSFAPNSGKYLVPTVLKVGEGEVKVEGNCDLYYTVPVASDVTTTKEDGHYTGFANGGTYYYDRAHTQIAVDLSTTSGRTEMDIDANLAKAYFTGALYDYNGVSINVAEGSYSVRAVDSEGASTKDFNFGVAESKVEGLFAFENGDVSDTTFVYNAKTFADLKSSLGFADKDGKIVSASILGIRDAEGNSMVDSNTVDAGEYVARIEVDGTNYSVRFTVNELDLEAVSIVYADTTTLPANNNSFISGLTIDGMKLSDYTNLASQLKLNVTNPAGGSTFDSTANGEHGWYKVLIEENSDNPNIKGTGEVSFAYLDADMSSDLTVKYGDMTLGSDLYVNLFKGEAFDAGDLSLVASDGTVYGPDDLEVTYDGDLTKATASPVAVTVRLNAFKGTDGKWYGGSKTINVTVTGAELDADERLYFYLDGKLAGNGATVTYDGGDWLEKLEVVVKDADGNDIDPSNYDVKVTDASGKEVDEVVDAGDYKVQVTGKTFKFDSATDADFDLKVNPVVVSRVAPVWDVETGSSTAPFGYLTYTGEVLTPSYTFYDADGNEVQVPAEAYDVTYKDEKGKDVELKEVGTYYADFETAVDVKNYVVDVNNVRVDVTDKGVFLDVPTNEWYSQAVYDAKALGYMNGEGNGYLFNPQRELTRAEAACILFNMAGGDEAYPSDTIPGYYPNGATFETGFSDVEGNEFYAKAIAWAKATGVVNGYADGTFGVSRNVTSEEFACMLANFERAKGGDTTVDADEVLSGYADASSVSDWAKDSVAWAVESGVMGNSAELAPSGSILRMRVAAMVVNYQPEKLGDLVIKIPSLNN